LLEVVEVVIKLEAQDHLVEVVAQVDCLLQQAIQLL
jgi:hypothetical protein